MSYFKYYRERKDRQYKQAMLKTIGQYQEPGLIERWFFTHYEVHYCVHPRAFMPGVPYYPEYIRRMIAVRAISRARAVIKATPHLPVRAQIENVIRRPGLLWRLRRGFSMWFREAMGRPQENFTPRA